MNEIFSSDNKMTLFEQTLEIMKKRGAWCASVHGVAKSDVTQRLNNILMSSSGSSAFSEGFERLKKNFFCILFLFILLCLCWVFVASHSFFLVLRREAASRGGA